MLLATLSKKQQKITSITRVEVDAYIHGLKTQWFYALYFKKEMKVFHVS